MRSNDPMQRINGLSSHTRKPSYRGDTLDSLVTLFGKLGDDINNADYPAHIGLALQKREAIADELRRRGINPHDVL